MRSDTFGHEVLVPSFQSEQAYQELVVFES